MGASDEYVGSVTLSVADACKAVARGLFDHPTCLRIDLADMDSVGKYSDGFQTIRLQLGDTCRDFSPAVFLALLKDQRDKMAEGSGRAGDSYFGGSEHIKSMSRDKLEDFARYLVGRKDETEAIAVAQSAEIVKLRRKIANQSKQLVEVQRALEDRNRGRMKSRWQRAIDRRDAELGRYRKLVSDLRLADGWPDDDKLRDYGISPDEVVGE